MNSSILYRFSFNSLKKIKIGRFIFPTRIFHCIRRSTLNETSITTWNYPCDLHPRDAARGIGCNWTVLFLSLPNVEDVLTCSLHDGGIHTGVLLTRGQDNVSIRFRRNVLSLLTVTLDWDSLLQMMQILTDGYMYDSGVANFLTVHSRSKALVLWL